MDPFTLASLGAGLFGSIGKMFGRGSANRRLRELEARMPKYQANPLAAQRLGLAQTLLNARMPGAAAAEKNIYQAQANQIAAAERASTDPNQILLAGAGATGQAGQAFQGLAGQEAADYQRRLANLSQAQEGQMAEQQREYQDKMNRYQMQAQIEAGQQENRQNTWGDIANLGFTGAMLGQQGMFKGMFGGSGAAGRMATMPQMTPAMGGFRGALPDSYNPTAVSNMMNIGIPQPQAGFMGALPFPTSSPYNIPTYLNPQTQPYQQTLPSQWWMNR